jgi:aryl-alcohol dehydrogenase-like predicted oxidoreductase
MKAVVHRRNGGPEVSGIDMADAFKIGADLSVRRLGFGAMRLTGRGVWGPPEDVPAAQAVLRRAVDLGVNFIDTAGSYGPGDNERLIRDTLRPYPVGLVIGTKGGMRKTGPSTPESWGIELDASESFLRQGVEGSLRDLGVERIDLYQLHRVDPKVPIEDTMGVLSRLQDEGKIRHVGLSAVDVEQIDRARRVVDIATVQNEYNLSSRTHDDVLAYCEQHAIGFIPFYPQRIGELAEAEALRAIAARENATPAMVALAWLLRRSPVMIPIPGTSSRAHLEENVDACRIALSDGDMAALGQLGI